MSGKRENFYRRDPGLALAGMATMSLEERGVYNTVIDLLYLTWRPLEDNPAYIAGHCMCAVQKLNPILNRLIDKGKLIRFEESGQTYISNPKFEDERNAVKGPSATRSGRAKVEEKSAGVREKSASVAENPPLLPLDIQQNQPFTALEKSREDKTEAKASFVAESDGDAPRTKGERRPYPEAFEAAWKAYPHTKGRSSKPLALARWQKLPRVEQDAMAGAAARFAPNVAAVCGGKGAPDMAVWIGDGKHLNWLEDDAGAQAAPAATFAGPAGLRAAVVAAKDEAFAVGYLDPCGWEEGPPRRLIARNAFIASEITKAIGAKLQRAGVEVVVQQDRAA